MSMMDDALVRAETARQQDLDELFEFLRFPGISTLKEHEDDIRATAEWLADKLLEIGLDRVELLETNGHPAVYAEWLNAPAGAPTILFYGHYDVQPIDPVELWHSAPFAPEVRDGLIYARGATDDKGQVYAHIAALRHLFAGGEGLPFNLKMLIEGEEEIGSRHLGDLVRAEADRLACDVVLVSDTSFIGPGKPEIFYSLRGAIGGEIHVRGPRGDMHSGAYGGVIMNPLHALAKIIASFHDDEGRIAIAGYLDDVRPLSEKERRWLSRVPLTEEDLLHYTGSPMPWGDKQYTLLERIGAMPTVEVNGMWGGFQGEGGKTIIPSEAHAKITMRLVPDQDPREIERLFVAHIERVAPPEVIVEVRMTGRYNWPLLVDPEHPYVQTAVKALRTVWETEAVYNRGGGSISILSVIKKLLDVPIVLMGFALPGANVHAPNENFPVAQYHNAIRAVIAYYSLVGEGNA